MNILFYDTETTGLPKNWKAPSIEVDNWPHIVQLAWILSEDSGEEKQRMTLIIKPEGYEIPKDASELHGITTEMANALGVPLIQALEMLWESQQKASYLVAHNSKFDGKMVRAACHRAKFDHPLTKMATLDTMLLSTKFCNLPGQRGPKWPKLEELHKILFGVPHDNAHDAMGDVDATIKCFFELQKRGVITQKHFEIAVEKQKEYESEKTDGEAAK
jgi:DNA polymerase III epsilon subunit-like protein